MVMEYSADDLMPRLSQDYIDGWRAYREWEDARNRAKGLPRYTIIPVLFFIMVLFFGMVGIVASALYAALIPVGICGIIVSLIHMHDLEAKQLAIFDAEWKGRVPQ